MSTSITNNGIITSFANTPQAKDDLFANTGITEDSGTFILDVMGNDLGGRAKSLWSLDNAESASTNSLTGKTQMYAPADLLSQDHVGIVNYSKVGAAIMITADGKVSYTMTAASKAHFQSLAAGEIGTDTFTYAIRMGNGTLSWATASVQIAGVNDVPTVTGFSSGALTEDVAVMLGNLTSTGTITFDDVDLTDAHTVSVVATGNPLGGVLTASVTDSATGAGDGTVTWNYAVANSATQSLAQGQQATETFTVTISDGNGGTISQNITITVTGTNDGPIAVADTNAGLEDSSITGTVATNDNDVDAGAVLSYSLNAPVAGLTINANGSYSFDASHAAYQSLAQDATLDVVANYTVTDEHGETSTSTLTITLTGTNDAPIAVADTNAGLEDSKIKGTVAANDSDVDNDANLSFSLNAPVDGLKMNSNGSYSFNAGHAAYQSLALGATLDVVANYTVTDEHGLTSTSTLTITLTGTNDAPVADKRSAASEPTPEPIPDPALTPAPAALTTNDPNDFDGQTGTNVRTRGDDTLVGTSGDDTIRGLSGNDILYGGLGNDVLNGDSHNDTIYGGSGNDNLSGSNGNDTIYGGSGNDSLNGNNNNDILIGGYGNDTLTGNGGADRFRYLSLDDRTDTITDFSMGEGDKLDLTALLANLSGATPANAFSAGYVQFVNSGGNTQVMIDMDGSAGATSSVLLVSMTGVTLTSADTAYYIL